MDAFFNILLVSAVLSVTDSSNEGTINETNKTAIDSAYDCFGILYIDSERRYGIRCDER